ncbi:hypothetical protein RZF15_05527 [Klebsiella pneumoniae]
MIMELHYTTNNNPMVTAFDNIIPLTFKSCRTVFEKWYVAHT